eukprot:g6195.t1
MWGGGEEKKCMVAYEDKAVLYGGCNIAFDVFYNDVWMADFKESAEYAWQQVETVGDKPKGSCGHGAAVVQGNMYVFGGLVEGKMGNSLHMLNLKTLMWAKVSSNIPSFLAERSLIQHSMVPYSDGFVVVGGTGAKVDDDSAYRFFTHNSSWVKISTGLGSLSGVGGPAAVQLNDTLLVLGGFVDDSATDSFMYLESASSMFRNVSVTKGSDTLGQIAFTGAIAIGNNFLVIYGGFSMTAINPYVWIFKWEDFPRRGRWCNVGIQGISPEPHFAAGLVAIQNKLYAFGGRIHPAGHNEELASDMWRLDDLAASNGECSKQW